MAKLYLIRGKKINFSKPLALLNTTHPIAFNFFGVVSCINCNTTNPKDKEICSGCGKILKYQLQGQTIL